MAQKTKIGDVLEITTPKGLAYAQYTHQDAKFGGLIRVLKGLHAGRPKDLGSLVVGPTAFVIFYPVRDAVKQGFVSVVENHAVPTHAQAFPVFRSGVPDPVTKKVENWWFWDGQRSWPVGELSTEQRKMPIRGLVNHTALVHLIVSEWTPEKDAR